MRAGRDRDFVPGAPISLHFFEPRYKILIRRAWEGNRVFVWAQVTTDRIEVLSQIEQN